MRLTANQTGFSTQIVIQFVPARQPSIKAALTPGAPSMATRQEWYNWFERARHADPLDVAQRLLGARLEKVGASEWAGPCPRCGGGDRFSVNVQKKLFNCRSSTVGGGSPIDMVMHCTGRSHIEAAEAITGEPRPDQSRNETEEDREERLKAHQRFIVAVLEREDEQRRSHEEKQSRDERTIEEMLKRAVDLDDACAKHGQAFWSRRAACRQN